MDNIIKIHELSYKQNEKIILNKISLNIEKNTWISVVGPNKEGKSSLIKILAGIITHEGYINIDSLVLDNKNLKEIRKKIGIVLGSLDNQLIGTTPADDLAFPLENLNYSKEEIKIKIKEISEYFEIENLLSQNTKDITNSEKQQVSLCSALITEPKILLLDNAFHELEPNIKEKIFHNLKKYKKEHKLTIIMVTQNIEDTLNTDKILILNKGKIVKFSSPISILKDEKLLKENSLKQPFIIELSQKLMLYNLIDHIYIDERKLVMDLWK